MKRILSILAVALAVTVWYAMPASAAKVDVNGEVEARGFYIQSADFTKDGDNNWLDARFRLDAKINQGMTTAVLQMNFLSASMAADGDSTGILVLGNDTGNTYDLATVRQAYLAVNFPVFTLIGGRYEAKLGHGLVLNDTVDLVAVSAPIGPVNLLVGYVLLGEDDAPVPAANPAGDDAGFALNVGVNDIAGSGFNAAFFTVMAHLQSVDPDNKLQVYGLTGDGKIGPANLGAEVNIFSGDATSSAGFEGTNFLLTGGIPADSVGLPVGLSAAILYASGQGTGSDVNINTVDGDFRASNILVRDDFNNYEGVTSLSVGTTAAGSNGSYQIMGYGLQAVKAAVALPSMDALGMTHAPELGLVWAQTSEDVQVTPSKKSTDLGLEIYVNTNCEVDKNLSANIGVGYLLAGDALGHDDGSGNFVSPEDQLKLEASLKFHF